MPSWTPALLLCTAVTFVAAAPGALRGSVDDAAPNATLSEAPGMAAGLVEDSAQAGGGNISGETAKLESNATLGGPMRESYDLSNTTFAGLIQESNNSDLEPEALAEWHGGGHAWHGGGHPGHAHPGYGQPGHDHHHGGSGFCAGRHVGWACMGTTHVNCCYRSGCLTACGSVANYHGCGYHAPYYPPPYYPPPAGGATSFCVGRHEGWYCMGQTRVRCCQQSWGWTSCETVSHWHGCF